eukprot:CAMPEP_0113846034 /NCGR_PEP_ID=MMETSP0372-20130328/1081_1 /TAXON_ID=340204 /ORGANISM="Lankesteria abbotti" /LENGTH=762 /DNA_ID=CAMNT_0000815129 /DNA_START=147 /DNA_END=2435 /DNA_ORIENTATION=- /assembly_acc=CAM_ASM_000359
MNVPKPSSSVSDATQCALYFSSRPSEPQVCVGEDLHGHEWDLRRAKNGNFGVEGVLAHSPITRKKQSLNLFARPAKSVFAVSCEDQQRSGQETRNASQCPATTTNPRTPPPPPPPPDAMSQDRSSKLMWRSAQPPPPPPSSPPILQRNTCTPPSPLINSQNPHERQLRKLQRKQQLPQHAVNWPHSSSPPPGVYGSVYDSDSQQSTSASESSTPLMLPCYDNVLRFTNTTNDNINHTKKANANGVNNLSPNMLDFIYDINGCSTTPEPSPPSLQSASGQKTNSVETKKTTFDTSHLVWDEKVPFLPVTACPPPPKPRTITPMAPVRSEEWEAKVMSLLDKIVMSMYDDRIRPTVHELWRRLVRVDPLYSSVRYVQKLLQSPFLSHLYKLSSDGEVLLVNPPASIQPWIDPKRTDNPFPPSVWASFLRHLVSLLRSRSPPDPCRLAVGSTHKPPTAPPPPYQFLGGRYGMALELQRNMELYWDDDEGDDGDGEWRNQIASAIGAWIDNDAQQLLPVVPIEESQERQKGHRLTLGHLCHLVQLATTKGFLQYENNVLQPRAASFKIAAAFLTEDAGLKVPDPFEDGTDNSPASLAEHSGNESIENSPMHISTSPMTTSTTTSARSSQLWAPCTSGVITDQNVILRCLNEILMERPEGILLSQIKKAFSARIPMRLSPTIFGYTRISSLLLSTAFKHICRVFVDNRNHVLVQHRRYLPPPDTRELTEQENEGDVRDVAVLLAKFVEAESLSRIPLWHAILNHTNF